MKTKKQKEKNNQEKFLEVKVLYAPAMEEESIKEKAKAVSSQNLLGNFDILPDHTNFITLIMKNLTIHTFQKKINFQFERGVLEVSENKVNIFLGL